MSLTSRVELALSCLSGGAAPNDAADEGRIISIGACSARPLSRTDFLRRARSFRIATWFGHGSTLSPFVLARRGWVNVGRDTVSCESCGSSTALGAGVATRLSGAAAPSATLASLADTHLAECAWRTSACPRIFASLPRVRALLPIAAHETRSLRAAAADAHVDVATCTAAARAGATATLVRFASSAGAASPHALVAATSFALATLGTDAVTRGDGGGDGAETDVDVLSPATGAALLVLCGWRVVGARDGAPTPAAKRARVEENAEEVLLAKAKGSLSLECHVCGALAELGALSSNGAGVEADGGAGAGGAVAATVLSRSCGESQNGQASVSATPEAHSSGASRGAQPATEAAAVVVECESAAIGGPTPLGAEGSAAMALQPRAHGGASAAARAAVAAATAAMKAFTSKAPAQPTPSPLPTAPSPPERSVRSPQLRPAQALPAHHWSCPYSRAEARLPERAAEIARTASRVHAADGVSRARAAHALTVSVGSALAAVARAAGGVAAHDAHAQRLIQSARGGTLAQELASAADSDGEGDEWGSDENTATRVEGWLACVLELLGGVFPV